MGTLSPALAVKNVKETVDFYKNCLGFKVSLTFPDANNPEYADLAKDGMVLMFLPAASLGIGSEEKLGTGINLYMQIDGDIDEYYDELKKSRVNIVAGIKDEPYGIRDFTVEDNNGYRLTFNQASRAAKICMSCGMPMTNPEDFGGGNIDNIYCSNCSNPDGSLKSYQEVFKGMVEFMMTSQNINRDTAGIAAKEYMAKMPAWSGSA